MKDDLSSLNVSQVGKRGLPPLFLLLHLIESSNHLGFGGATQGNALLQGGPSCSRPNGKRIAFGSDNTVAAAKSGVLHSRSHPRIFLF